MTTLIVIISILFLTTASCALRCDLRRLPLLHLIFFKNKLELDTFNGTTATARAYELQEFADNLNVYIFGTRIPFVCNDLLRQLSGVGEIEFQDIGITEIEPYAFINLNNLRTVAFYYNTIRNIPAKVFSNSTIEHLRVEGNKVINIESGAFDDMPELQSINLNENQLKKIDPNWFKACPKLSLLDLSGNLIKEIPGAAFNNLATSRLCRNRENKVLCPEIILTGNKISYFNKTAFEGLEKINHLVLDGNLIDQVPNLFRNVDISILSLKSNQISCISDEVLSSFRNMGTIYLESNNFTPDCEERLRIFKEQNVMYISF